MLTRKQFELLRFINERLKEAGVPPSFDEMKDALDLRSKSGIHRLITALEERGFIRRLPNRARAIEVIKLPESVAQGVGGGRTRGFTPSVIEGNLGRVRTASEDDGGRPVAVPVMGRIAAERSDLAFVSSDNPRTEDPERIIDDIVAGMGGAKYVRIADRREAIARAISEARAGDTLVLAGKGHETYQVIGTVKQPFDERDIVARLVA